MNRFSYTWPLLWMLLLAAVPPVGAQETEDIDWTSEACMDCHDDIPAFSHKTVHNPTFKVRCEDCHGAGTEHIDDPEPTNITARGAAGQALCLSCHKNVTDSALFHGGRHGGAELFCNDCHSPHGSAHPTPKLLVENKAGLCRSCHEDVAAAFHKPFRHELGHGDTDCVSCHEVHGTNRLTGPDHARETQCLTCHRDKTGPFVFSHVTGIAGDCLSCHEPHGSVHPFQLTRPTVDQLCLECHSSQPTPTLGSQPPAIHDMRSPRYRNCTTCHKAVHGSHTSPLLLK